MTTPGVDSFRYETWELDELVQSIEPLNPFLLEKFFNSGSIFSDAATIEWDLEEGGQRLAPFVSPFVPGRPVTTRGHMTAYIKPAYIKPAKVLWPGMGFVRQPGERYGGTLTPQQRMDILLAKQIALHDDMLVNRQNWMASSALSNGSILISGEDYQAVTVDFGQDANLRPATLSGGARWSQTTALPADDIENLALQIRKLSYGAVADTVVMDGQAWAFFRARMAGNIMFTTTQRVAPDSTRINITPRNDVGGEQVGVLGGRFAIWVYDGQYEDNDGVSQPFMPALNALVVSSTSIQGRQYYGAIQDLQAQLRPIRIFHKTKLSWDPSGIELLSQSAPVIAPRRRNSYGRLVVNQ